MKTVIKNMLKSALLRSRLLRLRAMFMSPSAVIIGHHSVSPSSNVIKNNSTPAVSSGITATAEQFETQMKILRQEYVPVSMDDIADFLHNGKKLPRRAVAITFDDGFEDNYSVAAPIMEQYDIRGTFYLSVDCVQKQKLPWFCRLVYLFAEAKRRQLVITDTEINRTWNFGDNKDICGVWQHYGNPCAAKTNIEIENYVLKVEKLFGFALDLSTSPKMMSFQQAKELKQRGHIIGNHTFSHSNVAHVPPEELRNEITGANEILERELGFPVKHFSYPHPCLNPQYNEKSIALTKELNYKTAVLTDFAIVNRDTNPYLIPRVMTASDSDEVFRWRIENAFAGRKI